MHKYIMDNLNEYLRSLSQGKATDLISTISTPDADSKKIMEHWTGKVIDNDDPSMLGRCKIRIFGFYDNIDDKHLPWAMLDSSYLGSSAGNLIIPEINTVVRGYFENGDIQKPVYNSMINNPIDSIGTSTFMDRLWAYPNLMVLFETDDGDRMTLNRSTGLTKFVHRSGTQIEISADGDVRVSQSLIPRGIGARTPSCTFDIAGDLNLNALGNINISSKKTVSITCGPQGFIDLGNNPAKQFVSNQLACFCTSAPRTVGNMWVRA